MFEPFTPFAVDQTEHALLEQVKTNIRGILDSYHGDWDFLIEMLQNAVDALEEKFDTSATPGQEKPQIEIVVDVHMGTVRVTDNGVGLDPDVARRMLAPNFTTKPYRKTDARRSLRGHKGVGLTFLAFSTDFFRCYGKKDNNEFAGELHDGRAWVQDESGDMGPPKVQPSVFAPEALRGYSSGASFEVRIGDEELARFGMTWQGWYTVIRTQTAAAFCDLNRLHAWANDAKVSLRLIDAAGRKVESLMDGGDVFPMRFLFPHENLGACDLDGYHRTHQGVTSIPASEKSKYEALYVVWDTDRIEEFLFDKGEIEAGTDRYHFYQYTRDQLPTIYALFTHSQRVWRDRLDVGLSNDRRRRFWKPGIQVVTHQMPSGQMIEVYVPFTAGYRDRIYMLVALEDARPDYGRKGFKSDVVAYVQYLANQAISYFVKNRGLLRPTSIAHGGTDTDAEAAADRRLRDASGLPDIGVTTLSIKKEPQYENDVIFLFSELLGRDLLKGFEVLSASSAAQYDAVVNYSFTNNRNTLIYDSVNNPLGVPRNQLGRTDLTLKNLEFKHSLDDLVHEFEEGSKSPQHVRFAVVWDEGAVQQAGFEVIELQPPAGHLQRSFHGQTHKLVMEGGVEIPVLILKTVLKVLKEANLLA
ncbi:MAG: ATP-binding protein [Chloroflexi bacterium]|nr:ATP-binding protein [Chloroflexota bacterium]